MTAPVDTHGKHPIWLQTNSISRYQRF